MKTSDLLAMSVKNLTRRKFRTSMTIMGVIIGTCAIVVMISLGIGINQSYSDFLASMGDLTTIEVRQGNPEVKLTDEVLQEFLAMEGVATATPFMNLGNLSIYDGKILAGKGGRYETHIWSLVGIYPEALEQLDFVLADGKPMESNPRRIELVVGSDVAYNFTDTKRKWPNNYVSNWPDEVTGVIPEPFFDIMAPNEMELVIMYAEDKSLTYEVEVVGVLQEAGDNWEVRGNIYMDVRDMERLMNDFKKATKSRDRTGVEYSEAKVKVSDIKDVGTISAAIEEKGFRTYSMEAQRQEAMKQTQMIQLILGSLGGISLFVAAISIANTMVMSVYERTREIGIMKVLGCFVSDIRKTFLVEASLIGFLGGVAGVLLSYLISYLLNRFGGPIGQALGMISFDDSAKLSIIPLWLVLLGIGFATIVGIVSGIYPARRAVRISALEAIKQE